MSVYEDLSPGPYDEFTTDWGLKYGPDAIEEYSATLGTFRMLLAEDRGFADVIDMHYASLDADPRLVPAHLGGVALLDRAV